MPATRTIQDTTQLIDIFPTVMELAGVPVDPVLNIDGHSLVPFLGPQIEQASPTDRPDFIISQFHGQFK